VAAAPQDAKKSPSGLASKVIKAGTGKERPRLFDKVTVHYSGWTTDGKMFDSSVKRGKPATFGLKQVIRGWTEGLQLMVVGEKRRLWIPDVLAYKGVRGRPQGTLVFDVELVSIEKGPEPKPAPPDVAAPKDAKKTKSGIAYRFTKRGSGRPVTAKDVVKVEYAGWTADGEMFDSSAAQGRPATFPVGTVIAGWREGLQLTKKGDVILMWIPEELAYKGKPGAPKGTLTFEMEILDIITAPVTPKDVAAPPKDAKKTEGGVSYKLLKKGTGKENPKLSSSVVVHYSGWTTDGEMFDSSIMRGVPASFRLTQVIPGWSQGLQKLVVGDKARLWIPEELAYKGQPKRPQGMLVFDVELLEFK
jgi:peptidylprolyl isomerase